MGKDTSSEIVEVKMHFSWVQFAQWVGTTIPNGVVPLKVVNGLPCKLEGTPKVDVRFDKKNQIFPSITGYDFDTNIENLAKKPLTRTK